MALSLSSMALPKPKKKPVTLQTEEQAVAKPVALQQRAPSPPREAAPAPATQATVKPTAVQTSGPAMTTFSNGPALPKPALPSAGERASNATTDYLQPDGMPKQPAPPTGPRRTVAGGPLPGAEETIREGVAAGALPASNEQFNEQIRMLMQDLISGRGMDVSTDEEEALIRELMQDRLGQGLVEQRARMGRAGFGASGALAAMEGDVRRQAGQQATQETLALRRQAEQEAIDNALRSIGVDLDVRGEARKSAFDEEFLNALKSSLGLNDGEGAGGGRPQGSPANLGETSAPGQGSPTNDRQSPVASPDEPNAVFMLGSRSGVPNNAAYSRTESGYDIYVDPNGNEYHVPAGA
jgi:hypothetical protein